MSKDADSPEAQDEPTARRNFALLTLYQVLMRTGWIFKTESIIMPAVLDTLSGGAGWMRAALPLLNRVGQSLPPVLVAGVVRRQPLKKWICCGSVALMSLTFVGVALIWLAPGLAQSTSASTLYLACYGLFFVFLGVNQLAQLTLQGKLLLATQRGRLLSISNAIGSVAAVTCALLLLPLWLREKQGDFELLFLFTAALFACGAVVTTLLVEQPDSRGDREVQRASSLRLAGRTLARNTAFRRVALVAFLYGTSTILFPHYQALAQQQQSLDLRRMIIWVAVQNIGTGVFSVPAGMLHQRYGTRLVLRILMLGICLIPPVALAVARTGEWAAWLYSLVFLLVGLSPVAIRTLSDYTLEVSPQPDHPQYLGMLNLCISAPILLSVPAGWLIDRTGFAPVFLGITVLLVIGWLCTFSLSEPRKRIDERLASPLPSLDSEASS